LSGAKVTSSGAGTTPLYIWVRVRESNTGNPVAGQTVQVEAIISATGQRRTYSIGPTDSNGLARMCGIDSVPINSTIRLIGEIPGIVPPVESTNVTNLRQNEIPSVCQ
jgi:hypothetical protein